MRKRLVIFVLLISLCAMASLASAREVRVFKPMEEDMSPMQLRNEAMAEGFALAAIEEARLMLAGDLDEVRADLLKKYFMVHGKPYIQGYRIVASEAMDAGLILRLDVRINRKALREGLKRMGIAATVVQPQAATVTWPEDLPEEAVTELQGLVTLTGLQPEEGVQPAFTLEYGPEKAYKGRLVLDDREWMSINKDMTALWFELWARFFNRNEAAESRSGMMRLAVSGWFSPDAALEFDRVLRGWERAVQEARLVEVDMQPTGVGATWEVRLLDAARLDTLLKSFLPQRGLSYQLAKEGAEE
ncbi:hypothetical protein [uncultured Pseudodesulfovibrio sp.]|uniref:hypothetical protein n=1 Tax=uncultured Pseudodesulfovibrio sp. TaxID=2035858 RepID=UPI0029C7B685|nr:hypothetical protein [uncultured Pseudodesulfovibrio sp.]